MKNGNVQNAPRWIMLMFLSVQCVDNLKILSPLLRKRILSLLLRKKILSLLLRKKILSLLHYKKNGNAKIVVRQINLLISYVKYAQLRTQIQLNLRNKKFKISHLYQRPFRLSFPNLNSLISLSNHNSLFKPRNHLSLNQWILHSSLLPRIQSTTLSRKYQLSSSRNHNLKDQGIKKKASSRQNKKIRSYPRSGSAKIAQKLIPLWPKFVLSVIQRSHEK